jgi:hypothetical protein
MLIYIFQKVLVLRCTRLEEGGQVMVLCLFCRWQDNKNKITLRDHDLLQSKELQS